MNDSEANLDRFSALSDGIFAVIITIMVLALKTPSRNDGRVLLELWPDLVSYTVSYAFIAIVWLNHHHVFKHATSRLPAQRVPGLVSRRREEAAPFRNTQAGQ
jgi:uncharacterized membrane protein